MPKKTLLTLAALLLIGTGVVVVWHGAPAKMPSEAQSLCNMGGPHHAGFRSFNLPSLPALD